MDSAIGLARPEKFAIRAEGLRKRYGKTWALRGVDLAVERGTVYGLLGPNGAGKTTVVRILATLLRPDAGHAYVAGHDVVRDAELVRRYIGLAGQYAAVDELLTGRANLVMVGRLYHLGHREAGKRADGLLERFDLSEAANRVVKTYSGGMRRRLDLAASLVASPPVLFLDEPTTGLDPRSRLVMWDVIAQLVADGTTVLLTTQYLEEADQLAHHIAVLDAGHVIATGTPGELKAQVGGARIDVVVREADQLSTVVPILRSIAGAEPDIEPDALRVSVPVPEGTETLAGVVRALDATGVELADIGLRRPTLDEVFLRLTGCGRAATETDAMDMEVA